MELSLPRARVQSLVGKLRFHELRGVAKKKQAAETENNTWQAPAPRTAHVVSVLSPTRCSPEASEPGHLFRPREEACESPSQAWMGRLECTQTSVCLLLHTQPWVLGRQGPDPARPMLAIHPGRGPVMLPQPRGGGAWMDAQVSEASVHLPRGIWLSPRKLRRPLGWLHPGTLPASAKYLPCRPVSQSRTEMSELPGSLLWALCSVTSLKPYKQKK